MDSRYAAYKLIKILFKEGLINFETYQRIEEEHKQYVQSKNPTKGDKR